MSILTVHATSYRGFSLSFQEGSGVRQPMSALGQKRTHAVQHLMSALPPKADICTAPAHVRFEPIGDIAHRECLAGAFKLDISNPVALAPAQAGWFILALEG